jgi:G3E family GTPase
MSSRKFILDKIDSKVKKKTEVTSLEQKVRKIVTSYISEAEMLVDNKVSFIAAQCISLIEDQLRSMDPQVKIEVLSMNKVLNVPETISIVWSEFFATKNNINRDMIISTMDNLFV